jgi:hypothetical protein
MDRWWVNNWCSRKCRNHEPVENAKALSVRRCQRKPMESQGTAATSAVPPSSANM